MPKRLISLEQVLEAAKKGEKTVPVDKNCIITPSALEKAAALGIEICYQDLTPQEEPDRGSTVPKDTPAATLAFGSDHGGFKLKNQLKEYCASLGYRSIDVGTDTEEACDYPEYAYAVARSVLSGEANCGIMVDSVGLASAMAANKVPGIRAACCWNEFTAKSSREHNNSNVLTLGGKVHDIEAARSIVRIWLETPFAGGRHQKRLDKISEIEQRFSRT